MPKSRVNDALAICHGPAGFNGAGEFAIERTNRVYTVKLVRRHNRQLHKATTGFVAAKLGFFMIPPFTESWLPSKCKGFHERLIPPGANTVETEEPRQGTRLSGADPYSLVPF